MAADPPTNRSRIFRLGDWSRLNTSGALTCLSGTVVGSSWWYTAGRISPHPQKALITCCASIILAAVPDGKILPEIEPACLPQLNSIA